MSIVIFLSLFALIKIQKEYNNHNEEYEKLNINCNLYNK
jgi:hypothetical protein